MLTDRMRSVLAIGSLVVMVAAVAVGVVGVAVEGAAAATGIAQLALRVDGVTISHVAKIGNTIDYEITTSDGTLGVETTVGSFGASTVGSRVVWEAAGDLSTEPTAMPGRITYVTPQYILGVGAPTSDRFCRAPRSQGPKSLPQTGHVNVPYTWQTPPFSNETGASCEAVLPSVGEDPTASISIYTVVPDVTMHGLMVDPSKVSGPTNAPSVTWMSPVAILVSSQGGAIEAAPLSVPANFVPDLHVLYASEVYQAPGEESQANQYWEVAGIHGDTLAVTLVGMGHAPINVAWNYTTGAYTIVH